MSSKEIFAFNLKQKVRILKTLTTDIYNILDILGKEGIVENRYLSNYGEPWYYIRVGNRVEPFKEQELDCRYCRKNNG